MSTPTPRIAWPYNIVSGINDTLHFRYHTSSGIWDNTTWGGSFLPSGTTAATYNTPEALLPALQGAVPSNLSPFTVTAALTTTGHVTFTFTVTSQVPPNPPLTSVDLLWDTAPAVWLGGVLGFNTSAGSSSASFGSGLTATITSDYQMTNLWYATQPVISDSRPYYAIARDTAESFVGAKAVDWGRLERRDVEFNYEPAHKIFIAQESTSHVNEAMERLFLPATSGPLPGGGAGFFTYSPDASNPTVDAYTDEAWAATGGSPLASGLVHAYSLQQQSTQSFKPERWVPSLPYYKIKLSMSGASQS